MSGFWFCFNLCRNFPHINFRNNKLGNASLRASTKNNGLPIFIFCTPTLGPTLDIAFRLVALLFLKKLFKQFMQTCIEKIKGQILLSLLKQALNRPFKARNLKLCFENWYMKYFYIWWQCKNYFKIARNKGYKRLILPPKLCLSPNK